MKIIKNLLFYVIFLITILGFQSSSVFAQYFEALSLEERIEFQVRMGKTWEEATYQEQEKFRKARKKEKERELQQEKRRLEKLRKAKEDEKKAVRRAQENRQRKLEKERQYKQ